MAREENQDWLWEIIACPHCGSPLEAGQHGTEIVCTDELCSYRSNRTGRRFDLLPTDLDPFQKAEDRFRVKAYERYAELIDWQNEDRYTLFKLLMVATGYPFASQFLFFRDDFVKRHKLEGRGLELGGATGHQSGFIKLFFPETEMVTSDVAPINMEIGEQLDSLLGFGIDYFVTCDAERLPFVPNSFDFVVSSALLHHLGDLKVGLERAYTVLKPGGRWYIVNELSIGALPRLFWNSRWASKGKAARALGIHENSYTLKEWRRFFLAQNFEIVEMYFHRNPGHKLLNWSNAAYYTALSKLPVGLLKAGLPCEVCFVLEKGRFV
jgi:ubiquinone/menaquinone biosynthesis C-methylase UbiE